MFTQEYLLSRLTYDPLTGELRWKEKVQYPSDASKKVANWNAKYAGKIADKTYKANEYKRILIDKKMFFSHTIIWVMLHKLKPLGVIDHIDGNRHNNRLDNLRSVNRFINARNTKLKSNNTSGYPGVHYDISKLAWIAKIHKKRLGSFDTFEEAKAARRKAEKEYGYHENHGRTDNEPHPWQKEE